MISGPRSSSPLVLSTLGLWACLAWAGGELVAQAGETARSRPGSPVPEKPSATAEGGTKTPSWGKLQLKSGARELRLAAGSLQRCRDQAQLEGGAAAAGGLLRECLEREASLAARYGAEARERGLAEQPQVRYRLDQALAQAVLKLEAAKAPAPSAELLQRVESEHAAELGAPERIRVFRILVNSQEEAREILAKLGESPKLQDFRQLARERSKDPASSERGGDLGFLWPDGRTEVPELRVLPALYSAVQGLPDGALASAPIEEAGSWAVVWRRGHLEARQVPDEQRAAILERLATELSEADAQAGLLKKLKAEHLSDYHPELVLSYQAPPR